MPVAFLGTFGDAIDFIFNEQLGPGGTQVGGLAEVGQYLWTQTWISLLALAISIAIARARSGSISDTAGGGRRSRSQSATRGAGSPSWR